MATTEKKMTKVNALTIALELVEKSTHAEKDAVAEKIRKEIENLSKKSGVGKPTAKQTANASIQDSILDTMSAEPNRLFTITELTKEVPNLPADMSVNRMSALVRQLKDAGKVIRIEDKRKALFRLA